MAAMIGILSFELLVVAVVFMSLEDLGETGRHSLAEDTEDTVLPGSF